MLVEDDNAIGDPLQDDRELIASLLQRVERLEHGASLPEQPLDQVVGGAGPGSSDPPGQEAPADAATAGRGPKHPEDSEVLHELPSPSATNTEAALAAGHLLARAALTLTAVGVVLRYLPHSLTGESEVLQPDDGLALALVE